MVTTTPIGLWVTRETRLGVLTIVFCSLLLGHSDVSAEAYGLVSDNGSNAVNLFSADRGTIAASLVAGQGYAVGDCAVASDTQRAYATSSGSEISFINLVGGDAGAFMRSSLVPISSLGVDMALSPDDAYLVVAGGGALQQPLSVVDTRQAREVSTADLFADHTSIEFCDNGTLLVTTTYGEFFGGEPDNALYDAGIDVSGTVSLLGNRLSSGQQPNNVSCAPGSLAGVLLDRKGGITSFTLPGLNEVQHFDTGDTAVISAAFSADGRHLFVRSLESIQSFEFNPVTGQMQPLWQQVAPRTSGFFGIDQIAMHPDGSKLFVDGGGAMLILDPSTGTQTGTIGMGDTTGICFANRRLEQGGAQLAASGPAFENPAFENPPFENSAQVTD